MKPSIYEWAVEETERRRNARRFQQWAFGCWLRNGLAVLKTWEERKPPENRPVMRSLELRG